MAHFKVVLTTYLSMADPYSITGIALSALPEESIPNAITAAFSTIAGWNRTLLSTMIRDISNRASLTGDIRWLDDLDNHGNHIVPLYALRESAMRMLAYGLRQEIFSTEWESILDEYWPGRELELHPVDSGSDMSQTTDPDEDFTLLSAGAIPQEDSDEGDEPNVVFQTHNPFGG